MDLLAEGARDVQEDFELALRVGEGCQRTLRGFVGKGNVHDEAVPVPGLGGFILQLIDRVLRQHDAEPADGALLKRKLQAFFGGVLMRGGIVGLRVVGEDDFERAPVIDRLD